MLGFAKPSSTSLWVSPLTYRKKCSENGNLVSFSKNPYMKCSLFAIKATSLFMNTTIGNQGINHNVEILRYCEVGDLQKAMSVMLRNEKLDLDMKTYCSILQLCAEMNSLDDGRRVHSVIKRNNVAMNGVIGSKLVFMYVTCGDLKEARRVFDEVVDGNVFVWNLLMNEYAKNGDFKESVFLFGKMIECGFEPDSYTFCCLFKSFAALGCLKDGETIHGRMVKLGIGWCSSTVMNSLIAFYFKVGKIESARKVFDKLSDRDVVSWNSVISGYVGNGFPREGVMIFNEMVRWKVYTDLATMASVLAACSDMKNLILSRLIHAYAIKVGFDTNIKFENSLLDVYSKCGDMHEAQCVFQNMEKRNIVSFTSMILGYAREGLSNEAIALLREMKQSGIPPDAYAITSMLQACAVSNSLENGKEVHEYVKETKMESDLFVCNALMDMYAKCGCMENANSVFSKMKIKDIVSWNTMIGGYSKNSCPHEAFDLFTAMQHYIKPDDVTITCILPACASLSAFLKGREIHGYVIRNALFSDLFVSNSLIDMYIKCGALGIATLLFEKLGSKDIVSWTIMIAGYGMHGYGDEAITTFKEMIRARIKPDKVSFLSILYACSHSQLLDEGWRFFDMMRNKFYIVPELDHYACMVDLLSRGGKLPQAYKFIQKMPIGPDSSIWGILLNGCRMYRDVEMAEKVADHVFDLEPERTEYYVLLANIYAEAEKWEEVKILKGKIGIRGSKDNAGCSWIEVKGKVYIFTSYYSNVCPEGKRVKYFLNCMREKMEEKKVLKLKYTLINKDEMQKEIGACTHSERLAIGYGVLNLSRNRVIRVAKNSRICGECHEMAKFVSKEMEREIVLRDSNRFHCFKDGACSCRGYW